MLHLSQSIGFIWTHERNEKWVEYDLNWRNTNRPFLSCLRPLFQCELKCEAIDMKILIYSYVNYNYKTHFHKKVLHLASFGKREFLEPWNGLVNPISPHLNQESSKKNYGKRQQHKIKKIVRLQWCVWIPGQGFSLHGLVSSLSPGHELPPNAGGGLVHVLDRFCTPPPQVTGHSLQSFQSDQLPSTEFKGNEST